MIVWTQLDHDNVSQPCHKKHMKDCYFFLPAILNLIIPIHIMVTINHAFSNENAEVQFQNDRSFGTWEEKIMMAA